MDDAPRGRDQRVTNTELPDLSWDQLPVTPIEHDEIDVRGALAENPTSPVDVLNTLANDDVWTVRELVARNPATAAETLTRLAQDSDWAVRRGVAASPTADLELLAQLGNDPEPGVRIEVLCNPRVPATVVLQLMADTDRQVKGIAAATARDRGIETPPSRPLKPAFRTAPPPPPPSGRNPGAPANDLEPVLSMVRNGVRVATERVYEGIRAIFGGGPRPLPPPGGPSLL